MVTTQFPSLFEVSSTRHYICRRTYFLIMLARKLVLEGFVAFMRFTTFDPEKKSVESDRIPQWAGSYFRSSIDFENQKIFFEFCGNVPGGRVYARWTFGGLRAKKPPILYSHDWFDALGFLHNRKFVHWDFKHDTILLKCIGSDTTEIVSSRGMNRTDFFAFLLAEHNGHKSIIFGLNGHK